MCAFYGGGDNDEDVERADDDDGDAANGGDAGGDAEEDAGGDDGEGDGEDDGEDDGGVDGGENHPLFLRKLFSHNLAQAEAAIPEQNHQEIIICAIIDHQNYDQD